MNNNTYIHIQKKTLDNLRIVISKKCYFNFYYLKNAMKICNISKSFAISDNSDFFFENSNFKSNGKPILLLKIDTDIIKLHVCKARCILSLSSDKN
jgi:hypothetical protein